MRTRRLYDLVAKRMIARDAAGALELVRKRDNYEDCRVYALEANVWEFQSRLAEAERLLRRALRRFPREPFAYLSLGEFCLDYGTKGEARTVLAKGLELALARRAGRNSPLGEEIVSLIAKSHIGARGGAARIEALARGLVAWPKSACLRALMLHALTEVRPRGKRRG